MSDCLKCVLYEKGNQYNYCNADGKENFKEFDNCVVYYVLNNYYKKFSTDIQNKLKNKIIENIENNYMYDDDNLLDDIVNIINKTFI